MNIDNIKSISILGGGESGVGAAILARQKGLGVFLSDAGGLALHYREVLETEGIDYEQGSHTAQRILQADLIVKSPGIPPTAPMVQQAVEKGIPVVSEIEFAGYYTRAKMICITGSNGKTTTTMLIHHLLQNAGIDTGLAGNIGRSLAWQVARQPKPVYVIELSSFQLEGMFRFRANIAVMMNITPDHLDRYDHQMQGYVDAKFRILQNMTPQDNFVYWADDPVMQAKMRTLSLVPQPCPFALEQRPGLTAWLNAPTQTLTTTLCQPPLQFPASELQITGPHNTLNALAAASAAALCGLNATQIAHGLSTFTPVEHRLEYVATIDGVRYINDSKATNVDSTFWALSGMTQPVVLILGGKDKGNDYSQITPLVREKVRAIVAMGKDNSKILSHFGGIVPVVDTHSLDQAVATCRSMARQGDTVLLSPCCASFDLFTSYEDRGRRFKAAVKALCAQ